jgi:hypothetical protein
MAQAVIKYNKHNFEFKINRKKRTITCIARGYFSVEEANAYIEAFKAFIATIEDIQNYKLVVDATGQEELPEEALPYLAEVEKMYMTIPFRSRQYIKLDNYNALTQVIGMGGKRFIDSFEPIEKQRNVDNSINSDMIEILKLLEQLEMLPNSSLNHIKMFIKGSINNYFTT